MKLNHLRWLLFATVVALIIVSMIETQPMTIGLSSHWTSDGEYRIAGGTTPTALAFAGVLIVLYLLLMKAVPSTSMRPLPGILRRFAAFWIDFLLAMMTAAPVLGVIPSVAEWRRAGEYQWTFERTTHATGDGVLTFVVLLSMFCTLLVYFAIPLTYQRPSPGACIMGYRVVSDPGTSLTFKRAVLRTILGFIAACAAYIAPFIARDRRNGKFWLDRVFNTRAVLLNG